MSRKTTTPNRIVRARRQRGQSLVEFMLVIPILLLTVFGLIEMARMIISYATIQHAAQEGARWAATGRCDDTMFTCASGTSGVLWSIEAHTEDSMVGLILNDDADEPGDPGYYEVLVLGSDRTGEIHADRPGDPGQKTFVNVTYSMPVITPFISSIVPAITLRSEVIVTNETQGGTLSQEGVLPPPLQLEEFQEEDDDGIPDDWELEHFGSPGLWGADDDPDGDGCDNMCEYTCGGSITGSNMCEIDEEDGTQGTLDPNDPDTDGDGMPDKWEVDNGLVPDDDDADLDADGDGYTNLEEYEADTDPQNPLDYPGAMKVSMTFNPPTMNEGDLSPMEIEVVVTDDGDDPIIGLQPDDFTWTFNPDPGVTPMFADVDPGTGTYTFQIFPGGADFDVGQYNVTVLADNGTSSELAGGSFFVYDQFGNFLAATLIPSPSTIPDGLVPTVELFVHVDEEGSAPVPGLAPGNFNWTHPGSAVTGFTDLGSGDYSFTLEGVDALLIGEYPIGLTVNDGFVTALANASLNVVSSVQTLSVEMDAVPQSAPAGTSTIMLAIHVDEEGAAPKTTLVKDDFTFDLSGAPGASIVGSSFANMGGGNYVLQLDVSGMSESGGFYSVGLVVNDGDAIGSASAPFNINASVPTCQVSGGTFYVKKKTLIWNITNDGTETLRLRSLVISWSGNHGDLKQVRWGTRPKGKKGKRIYRGGVKDSPAAFGVGGLPWYGRSTPEQRDNPVGNTGSVRFDWKSKTVRRTGSSFSIVAEWEDLSGNVCVVTGSHTN